MSPSHSVDRGDFVLRNHLAKSSLWSLPKREKKRQKRHFLFLSVRVRLVEQFYLLPLALGVCIVFSTFLVFPWCLSLSPPDKACALSSKTSENAQLKPFDRMMISRGSFSATTGMNSSSLSLSFSVESMSWREIQLRRALPIAWIPPRRLDRSIWVCEEVVTWHVRWRRSSLAGFPLPEKCSDRIYSAWWDDLFSYLLGSFFYFIRREREKPVS